MPERTHMGSIVRFISPDTDSRVRARDATRRPIPENSNAPSRISRATAP